MRLMCIENMCSVSVSINVMGLSIWFYFMLTKSLSTTGLWHRMMQVILNYFVVFIHRNGRSLKILSDMEERLETKQQVLLICLVDLPWNRTWFLCRNQLQIWINTDMNEVWIHTTSLAHHRESTRAITPAYWMLMLVGQCCMFKCEELTKASKMAHCQVMESIILHSFY